MVLPSCLIKRALNPSIKDVNQFLSSLLRAQKFELVLRLFSQITSNSIAIDSKTNSLISHAILKTCRFEEAEQFISDAERIGFLPQNRLWNSLIRKVCVLEGDPERALKLLQELTRNRGIVPSVNTFRTLVSSLSSRGKMDSALEVFETMIDRKNGYQVDNFVCSSIVSGFSKLGKPDLGVRFYERVNRLCGFSPNLIMNTAVVDAFGREGRIEEACDLVQKMEKKGIILDAVLYSSWISGYLREGFLMEGLRKHKLMEDRGIVSDMVCYTNIIDGLCKEGIVEKVIGLLDEMEKRNIRPNLITYTSIIGGFCKRNKFDEAFCVFKKMEETGMVIDEYVYSILIDCLCKNGDLDRAFSLLEVMENKGIKAGTVTYNAVINGLCKAGTTRKGDEVSENLVADNFTYSTLLHGYMKEKDVPSMMAIKRRFENDGISMDVVTCNVLIKALLMVGMVDDACDLFNKMPEMGLVANSITYCSMIDGHFKLGRINKALELFNEYRIASSSSSAICHNCVIKMLCKEGMLDMAVEVFLDLIERKIFPDSITYRKLIASHFKEHAGEGVLKFIHRMENSDLEVLSLICNDAVTFLSTKDCCTAALDLYVLFRRRGFAVTSKTSNVLLKCLLRNASEQVARLVVGVCIKFHGIFDPRMINLLSRYLCKKNVEKAIQFSNDMGNKKISVIVLRTAVDALRRKGGRFQDAYNFLKESEEKGLAVDLAAYSMVVDELCKEGYIWKALDLCASMKRKGIYPNIVIHNSVLNGLCRQGCLVEAFRLFDSLECNNVLPTVITYATLIGALCREGFLQDAHELFESMAIRGIAPNTRIYNLMISGYCNFGLIEEAVKLLYDLEEKCLVPDTFTVSAIISGYCLRGDIESALSIFDGYRGREIFPDFLGFMNLIKGFYAKGRMEEARGILVEMFQCTEIVNLINRAGDEIHAEALDSLLSLACEQGRIHEVIVILSEIRSMSMSSLHYTSGNRVMQFKNLQKIGVLDIDTARKDSGQGGAHPVACKATRNFNNRSNLNTAQRDASYANGCPPMVEEQNGMDSYENLMGKSLYDDFDIYYPVIASLCSKGELHKANNAVKTMLRNSG